MSTKLYVIFLLLFAASCTSTEDNRATSFYSQDGGKYTYLITHYDVLPTVNSVDTEIPKNPFGQSLPLTDKELTIVREGFKHVGQCVYKVTADSNLPTNTAEDLRQLLSKADSICEHKTQAVPGLSLALPITNFVNKKNCEKQMYVPLDQMHAELQDFRDLYGHKMPWYYDYLAMGASFVLLNGVFDIVTHDAQTEAIRLANKELNSAEYRSFLEEMEDLVPDDSKFLDPKEVSGFLDKRNKMIMDMARAEHKAEEVFGKILYAGRDTKMFGRTVNINPLWSLKQAAGKKLVPAIQQLCDYRGKVGTAWGRLGMDMPISIACLSFIVAGAGSVIGATAPFATLGTGKINSMLHKKEEQRTLDDLVGDWDNFRAFTYMKPEAMKKLESKIIKLSKGGTKECPPASALIDHYINPQTGRLY